MDEFSDDGFEDLDESLLQELENNAIQFTQAQKLAQSQAATGAQSLAAYGYGFEDDDLDDTVVIDERELQQTRPIGKGALPTPQKHHNQQRWDQQLHMRTAQQHPLPIQQRPQYPPPRPFPPAPSRPAVAPFPSQRFPGALPSRPVPTQSQFVRPPPPVSRPYPAQSTQALHNAGAGQNSIIASLQDRLAALETELAAARGETAIVRSKYDKAQVTHEAEIARLKKQNADQAVKQERAVETAMAAERNAFTELQFARQDLREELGRVKSRKKDGSTTPRKNKSWGMADGFNGIELTSSPSKTQALKRKDSTTAAPPMVERTPTKGKRKRPAVDSPTFALETHSGENAGDAFALPFKPVMIRAGAEELPFDFLKLSLDHSLSHHQPLTFDLFSRFAFPSDATQTFSSLIFQKLPLMGHPEQPLSLVVDFIDLMIDLWQRCLSERYHAPIHYLASLIAYALQLNTISLAPHIIASLIPVCTTTCQLVALPRFNSVDGDISQHPDGMVRQLSGDGSVTHCLSLLCQAALGCLSPSTEDPEMAITLGSSQQIFFWKTVDMEFVIALLSLKQPESDWYGIISLLWTSVLPDSIGPMPNPITPTGYGKESLVDSQSRELAADAVVERVSICLAELPRWAAPGSAKELQVRLAVLNTLVLFAASPFGMRHIARGNATVQRLVAVLCWAIDRLYDVDPPLPDDDDGDRMEVDVDVVIPNGAGDDDLDDLVDGGNGECGLDLPTLLCRVISKAVLLLHTLATNSQTADSVSILTQVAASNGGSQRCLLALARLSFAEEDLVLEAGIDIDTVERAHELLELVVTPDEGEGMSDLFGI